MVVVVDNQIFSSPPESCVKFQFKCPDPKTVFRPSFQLFAHLIVAVGLPHAGLLHVAAAAVSPLLELHAAKDSVPGVPSTHAASAPAAAAAAAATAAPVAAAAGAGRLPHSGRGTLRDPRGPTVLHAATVRAAAAPAGPTRNARSVGIAPAAPESEHNFSTS